MTIQGETAGERCASEGEGEETSETACTRARGKTERTEADEEREGIRNAVRMRTAWVYLQPPFPVTPTGPTQTRLFPSSLVPRLPLDSVTGPFRERRVSAPFLSVSLRRFVVHDARAPRDETTNFSPQPSNFHRASRRYIYIYINIYRSYTYE